MKLVETGLMAVLGISCIVIAMGLHMLACEMHVWAVDRMRNSERRAEYQGAFYSYARFISWPVRALQAAERKRG